jgi:hypothetical protein
LSDFILHVNVAAGFLPDFVIQAGSLRFLSLNEYMKILRNLRNPSIRSGQALKVATTRPNVPFGTGWRKSLNLCINMIKYCNSGFI